jgi:1,4-dihydroxy-2-naphthoate octaprenyltransferase
MLVAYFYSAKPFKFASRGLGDIMVFIAMGFLMTWGSYYVQIQQWSWQAFAACIPVGCLVVSILNMNNVRDYEDDFAVNKKTIPVRFGLRFGQLYHAVLLTASYVTTTLFVLFGLLPLAALAVWLTCPLAFRNVALVTRAQNRKAFIAGIKLTSLLHLAFGLVLAIAIVLARK